MTLLAQGLAFCLRGFFWLLPRRILLRFCWLLSYPVACLPLPVFRRNMAVLSHFSRQRGQVLNQRRVLRQSLYFTFKNLIDFFKFLLDPIEPYPCIFEQEDQKRLKDAQNSGRGVVGICMHLGNWELGARNLQEQGISFGSLYFEQLQPAFDSWLNEIRQRNGVKLFHRHHGLKQAIKHLKEGGMVTLLMDQDGTANGHFMPFLGLWVSWPRMAELFLRQARPVFLPMVLLHEGDGYRAKIFEPLEATDYPSLMQQVRHFYETMILTYPDQWLFFYDRFKFRHEIRLWEDGDFDLVLRQYREVLGKWLNRIRYPKSSV